MAMCEEGILLWEKPASEGRKGSAERETSAEIKKDTEPDQEQPRLLH